MHKMNDINLNSIFSLAFLAIRLESSYFPVETIESSEATKSNVA